MMLMLHFVLPSTAAAIAAAAAWLLSLMAVIKSL